MTNVHPLIFRAYGVAPAGPFECMYCQQGTDNENDICDECSEAFEAWKQAQRDSNLLAAE